MTMAPGPIYVGTELQLTFEMLSGETYVDPTTITFKTIDPNGTEASYTYGTDTEVGKSGTGQYYARITPNAGGRWQYRWETTGANTVVAKEGNFIVQYSPFQDSYFYQDYT